jgi:hypothetical protein
MPMGGGMQGFVMSLAEYAVKTKNESKLLLVFSYHREMKNMGNILELRTFNFQLFLSVEILKTLAGKTLKLQR